MIRSQAAPRRRASSRFSYWLHRNGRKIAAYIFLILGGTGMFIPFLWMVSTSLKRPGSVFTYPPRWIPRPPCWTNYLLVFQLTPFARYMGNTATYATLATVGQLLSCSLGGFVFARLRFPSRNLIFLALLATMMVPYQVTMIPTFILFKTLGWLDSYNPPIVPAFTGGAFGVFLLRQYFLTIPFEVVDAAKIDGAGWLTIYWRIFLPLAMPALATLGIFSFMAAWNDLLGPLIYLNSMGKYTVSIALAFYQGQHKVDWSTLMAASIISLTPVLILYFAGAQKYFVQGIATVGIKR